MTILLLKTPTQWLANTCIMHQFEENCITFTVPKNCFDFANPKKALLP